MPGAYLTYGYRERVTSMQPDLDALTTERLLLPPVFINAVPWTKGYFATVEHRQLESTDLLAQHCFWSAGRGI